MYITWGFITFAVSTMYEITLEEDLMAVLQVGMTKRLCGFGFVEYYKYWSDFYLT